MIKSIFPHFKNIIFPFLVLPFLAGVFEATTAHSTTYYVSVTGNNSNPGTIARPFRSIAHGVNLLTAGDTLYLRGGTYTERIDLATPNKTGTANAWITIAGYPGEIVTIRYKSSTTQGYGPIRAWGNRGYFLFENFVLDGIDETEGTKWQIVYGNHHFTLRNIEIKNFKSSGLYIEGNDITITNCRIHDGDETIATLKRFYGIYAHHGNNILIENNDIYNHPGGGLHLYPGPFSNLIVRGNRIHHNNRVSNSNVGGIILQGQSTSVIANALIYNNVVFNNGASTSGEADGISISNYTKDTRVWHNTVYGNKTYGLHIGHNTTTINTVVQNNISYNNAGGNFINRGVGTIFDHNLSNDPKVVNADAFDFRLQDRSPAIDGGIDLPEVKTDFRNVRRPIGVTHDIGAYESDSSDIKSLSAPKNLVAR